MEDFTYSMNQWMSHWVFMQTVGAIVGTAIVIFFMWCFYVYVTSRRDWFESDIRIRNAEKSYNLVKAKQVRLECLLLKDKLEKSGVDVEAGGFGGGIDAR